MNPDVTAALARMRGKALPAEPSVYKFVSRKNGKPLWEGSGQAIVPYDLLKKWCGARQRVITYRNGEACRDIPVVCRGCSTRFYRSKITQVNCPDCIAGNQRSRLRRGGAS